MKSSSGQKSMCFQPSEMESDNMLGFEGRESQCCKCFAVEHSNSRGQDCWRLWIRVSQSLRLCRVWSRRRGTRPTLKTSGLEPMLVRLENVIWKEDRWDPIFRYNQSNRFAIERYSCPVLWASFIHTVITWEQTKNNFTLWSFKCWRSESEVHITNLAVSVVASMDTGDMEWFWFPFPSTPKVEYD